MNRFTSLPAIRQFPEFLDRVGIQLNRASGTSAAMVIAHGCLWGCLSCVRKLRHACSCISTTSTAIERVLRHGNGGRALLGMRRLVRRGPCEPRLIGSG